MDGGLNELCIGYFRSHHHDITMNSYYMFCIATATANSQFSVMNVSVRTTMKSAAKCDKHCELQNSVSRQKLEHIMYFWDIPKSMHAWVSVMHCFNKCFFLHNKLLWLNDLQIFTINMIVILRIMIDKILVCRLASCCFSESSCAWCIDGFFVMTMLQHTYFCHEVRPENPLNLSI